MTTITIDDLLFKKAEEIAKREQVSLSELLQRALNNYISDEDGEVFYVSDNLVSKIMNSEQKGGYHSIEEINAMIDEEISNV